MKKVSFVIPAYNASEVIGKCIDSLVAQSLEQYEIIVINDGSQDDTLACLRKLQEIHPEIKIIDIPNGGPSNARNVGIENADGDYLVMIDSDDFLNDLTCIKRYIEIMETDSLDLLVFGCQDVFLKQNEVVEVRESKIKNAYYESRKVFFDNMGAHLLQQIVYSASNKIYKMSIVKSKAIKFDTALSMEEDFLFNIHYFEYVNKVRFIEESPYSYVHESGTASLSQKYVPNVKELTKMSFDKLIHLLEKERAYQNTNKRNVDIYFIKRVSGWINSLFTKNCTLSSLEKIKQIKEMMRDSVVQERLKSFEPDSNKDKILFILLKYKQAAVAYGIYGVLNVTRK